MILLFLFSLYLWTNALFHITTTFDPFGSLPRTDYMFVFSKDQRLRYTKENMAMNVLEGYETSELFCFWCSSWRASAGMNECCLLRHLNSFKCCWFNIFYRTHTSVRWLKGLKMINRSAWILSSNYRRGEKEIIFMRWTGQWFFCQVLRFPIHSECYILWGTALAAINSVRNSFAALCNTSMHWSKNTFKCRGLLVLHRWCNIEISQFETAKELRGQCLKIVSIYGTLNF